MAKLLKVFVRGLIVTLLLPFIVVAWAGYGVFCIGLFAFMFVKTTIEYFQGKSFNSDLPEDIEARRMVLEAEKREEQAKEMLNVMYQNTVASTFNNSVETHSEEEKSQENTDFFDDLTSEDEDKEEEDGYDSGSY